MKETLKRIGKVWGAFFVIVFLIVMVTPLCVVRIVLRIVKETVEALDDSFEQIERDMMHESK